MMKMYFSPFKRPFSTVDIDLLSETRFLGVSCMIHSLALFSLALMLTKDGGTGVILSIN